MKLTPALLVVALSCSAGPDDADETPVPPKDPITIQEGQPCLPGALAPGVFADVGKQLGVEFVHNAYPEPDPHDDSPYRWEDFAGVATADLDGDGALDLFFTNGGGLSRVYLTGGRGPMAWQGVDFEAPEPLRVVVVADVDGDGLRDLALLSRVQPLWRRGDGAGGFGDERPIRPGGERRQREGQTGRVWSVEYSSFSLALGDLDGDGDLDAYVGNQEQFEASGNPVPGAELLLLSDGAGGFEDHSAAIPPRGVDDLTFIASLIDLDDDGDLDIYEVNDAIPLAQLGIEADPIWGEAQGNRLYRNDGLDGLGALTLVDVTAGSGADLVVAGMGVAIGDYDNDGLVDLYVTTMLPDHNALLHNDGALAFSNVTDAMGADTMADAHDVGWGAAFFDADMDGWQDLLVLHGFIEAADPSYRKNLSEQTNVLFHNDGGTSLVDVTGASGLSGPAWSRSVAVGDLNRDGFPDLVVGNVDSAPYVYLNGCDEARPWLTVRLDRPGPNPDGIGARIRVRTVDPDGAERTQTRHLVAGSDGLYGCGAPEGYFGFPVGTGEASIEVRWPDGVVSTWPGIPTRRLVTIRE